MFDCNISNNYIKLYHNAAVTYIFFHYRRILTNKLAKMCVKYNY